MPDDHRSEPTPKTQQTQPKGIDPKTGKPYEPVEIPVPKEREIESLLSRAARPLRVPDQTKDHRQGSEDH
jgi:hypothetical protein